MFPRACFCPRDDVMNPCLEASVNKFLFAKLTFCTIPLFLRVPKLGYNHVDLSVFGNTLEIPDAAPAFLRAASAKEESAAVNADEGGNADGGSDKNGVRGLDSLFGRDDSAAEGATAKDGQTAGKPSNAAHKEADAKLDNGGTDIEHRPHREPNRKLPADGGPNHQGTHFESCISTHGEARNYF